MKKQPMAAIATKRTPSSATSPSASVSEKLLENSICASLAAIEIYNKPDFRYREQVFAILIANAWELLLKAKILRNADEDLSAIYALGKDAKPKITRSGQPMTIEIMAATKVLHVNRAVAENLAALVEIRDNAIHFYNSHALSYLLYTLGAAALRNYEVLMKEWFDRSLAEYNFYILPLAFAYNFKTLSLIDCNKEPAAVSALLRSIAKTQETIGTGGRYHFVCEIAAEVRSAKQFVTDKPDLTIAVEPAAAEAVVIRTQRLIDKYPLSYSEMIERVRNGAPHIKQMRIDAAIRDLGIKGNPDYSQYNFRTKRHEERYKASGLLPKGVPCIYNEDAVRFLVERLKAAELD